MKDWPLHCQRGQNRWHIDAHRTSP
jgi:hypothetical protein